jgi:hypothetical protein
MHGVNNVKNYITLFKHMRLDTYTCVILSVNETEVNTYT